METAKFVISWALRLLLNFVGFTGISFIAYSAISTYTQSTWPWFEKITPVLAAALTIVGTFLTAISIYFYSDTNHPPEKISVYITAPIVILGCLAALGALIKIGSLPDTMINGFALLAISGALLRLQPNPLHDERIYHKST